MFGVDSIIVESTCARERCRQGEVPPSRRHCKVVAGEAVTTHVSISCVENKIHKDDQNRHKEFERICEYDTRGNY